MGNCVACGTPTVPPGDGHRRPHRSIEGKAVAKEIGPAVSVKMHRVPPVQPVTTSDVVRTKNSKRKAEELLHDVETQGLPLHQVLAHLLPDTDHATVCCSPPWRSPPKLANVARVPAQPAASTEVKRKSSRQKAEERLRIVETQGLPLHQVFAHLVPDTHDRAACSPQREYPPRLVKVEGVLVQPAAATTVKRKIGKKNVEEMLRIVETDCLPMHQVFAHLLPDAEEEATVKRWRPALDIIPEAEE